MKYSFGLCVAVLLSFLFQDSSATTITIRDSVYADSITYGTEFGAYLVTNPKNALGVPDSQFAHLGPLGLGASLSLMFTSSDKVNALTIQDTATIYIWGQKDLTVDSSAAQVKFIKTDAEGAILWESQKYILNDSLTIIELKGKEYTYMEIVLTENHEPGDTVAGSQAFLIDAVLLVQDRDSTVASVRRPFAQNGSKIVTGYPNPFIAAIQQPTVVFRLEQAGEAVLKFFDVLGREVGMTSLGMLDAGDHSAPFGTATEAQVYFARLYLDGVPTGSAYRLIGQ